MVFADLLNPIFSPLLKLPSLLAIFIIAFIISLFVVLIYKKFTDQNLMKRLKEEIKELQKEMKTLKDNPKKMLKVQKQAMDTNMKYMMHSFKPTLYTIIPIILILGWFNAYMAYYPIVDNQDFTVTAYFDDGVTGDIVMTAPIGLEQLENSRQTIRDGKAEWVLKGRADTYYLQYKFNELEFEHKLIVAENPDDRRYSQVELREKALGLKKSGVDKIVIGNKKIRPLQSIPLIRSIPWIGNFGWLGTYIILSIGFSIGLRKLLKVY